ncbi:TPA: tape measure protein [Enterococcus faecalis]|nr:tape measure protein [Enterococcus faecalis]
MAIEDISFKIKSNIEKIKGELRDIDNQLKSLKNQRAELNVKAQQLNKAKSEISSINVALKKLSAQKAELKIGNEATDITKSKIKEINHAMDLLRAKKANLQITTTQLSGADTQLKKIDNEMIRLNNRKVNLQVSADGMQKTIDDSNTLRGRLAQLMNKKVRIDVSSNIAEIGNKFQDVGRKMQKVNPLGGKLDGIVGIGAAVNLVDRAFNAVTGSMDGAISRFDTLRNYPKMMSNLGIGIEDSNKSLEELNKGLDGLPTTMDDAVGSVTRFTSKNKDINKSTKQFLALNNALLAGGMSGEIQSSALEQISQSYSKGKPDMVEWRSLLTAMPAQVDQIAQAFGKTSDQLGDSLRDGTISMDEFMDKIVELNENGTGEFQSFKDQAMNSIGGIRTGISRLKTSVVKGVESMMRTIDQVLQDQGFGGIAGVFDKARISVNKLFKALSDFAQSHSKEIGEAIRNIIDFFKQIDWKSFGEGLVDGFKQLKSAAKGVYELVSPIFNLLGNGNVMKGLGTAVPLIWGAGKAFVFFGGAMKLLSPVLGIFGTFIGLFGKLSKFKIPSFGGKGASANPVASLSEVGTSLVKNAGNLALVWGAIKLVEELAQALQDIDKKVPNNFGSLQSKFLAMAEALSGMAIFVNLASKMPKAKAFTGGFITAILAGELILVAEALDQINKKVPGNLKRLNKKMAGMLEAMIGMGVFVLGVGALSTTAFGLAAEILGAFVTAGLAGLLMVVAESIKQIDTKVPSNLNTMDKKLENMENALQSIGKMNLGGLLGIFKNAKNAASSKIITGTMNSIVEIAKQLEKLQNISLDQVNISNELNVVKGVMIDLSSFSNYMNENSSLFGNIIGKNIIKNSLSTFDFLNQLNNKLSSLKIDNFDKGKIVNSINDLKEVIKTLTDNNSIFNGLKRLVISKIDEPTLESSIKNVSSLEKLNGSLKNIETLKFNKQAVLLSIGSMKEVVNELSNSNGIFHSFIQLGQLKIDEKNFTQSIASVSILEKMNNSLKGIETMRFNKQAVLISINAIKEVVSALTLEDGIFSSLRKMAAMNISTETFESAINNFKLLTNLNENLKNIEVMKFNKKAVLIAVDSIKETVNALIAGDGIFSGLVKLGTFVVENSVLDNASKNIDGISRINETISKLGLMKFNKDAVLITIGGVKDTVNKLVEGDNIFSGLAKLATLYIDSKNFDIAKEIIDKIDGLNTAIKKIEVMKFTKKAVLLTIDSINEIITKLSNDSLWDSLTKFLTGKMDIENISESLNVIDKLGQINTKLQSLNIMLFRKKDVELVIGAIQEVINKIIDSGIIDSIVEINSSDIDSSYIAKVGSIIDGLANVNGKLASLQNQNVGYTNVKESIKNIKSVLAEISNFPSSEGINSINELMNAFNNLITNLQNMSTQYTTIGGNWGQNLIQAFKSKNVDTEILKIIDTLLTKLRNKESNFRDIGSRYGNALKSGFSNALNGMENNIDRILNVIGNKATAMEGIGRNYGNTFLNAFNQAISGISTSINNQISGLQSSLNTLKLPDLPSGSSNTRRARRYADGGIVQPYYFAKGGLVNFKPKGPDTVPAMLSPNEVVLPEKSVRKFPRNVIFDLIRGNARGVADYFVGKEMTTINNARNYMNHITNITHNDNREINYSPSFAGASSPVLDANKLNRNLR